MSINRVAYKLLYLHRPVIMEESGHVTAVLEPVGNLRILTIVHGMVSNRKRLLVLYNSSLHLSEGK